MKRLGQPPIGYFYRRKGRDQRHRPIEDREGTIYWCYQIHGKRRAVCLHTEKIREALERVESMHGAWGKMDWDDYDDYLRSLVKMGERAQKELAERRKGKVTK